MSSQSEQSFDVIVVGAGLAGQLVTHFLCEIQPSLRILLIEKNEKLSVDHTWSFHDGDIPSNLRSWVLGLVSAQWEHYEVCFPNYTRRIDSKYYSLRAEDLGRRTQQLRSVEIRYETEVKEIFSDRLVLVNDQVLYSELIVDCRGWMKCEGSVAYQKFVGLDLCLKKPHGLSGVRLMDARVKQTDGYRFIYCLPWSEDRLLVEDTYYSLNPRIDLNKLKSEILDYVRGENWEVERIERVESGALPLALQKSSYSSGDSCVPKLGAGSGFLHPVTGYSVPYLLSALSELRGQTLDSQTWLSILNRLQQGRSLVLWYYRLLNRMLFWSADPDKRYIILQRFYRLSPTLISRYYGGRTSLVDALRILIGRPPVKIRKAIPMFILD